jgi:hypothetical protein
VCRRYRIPPSWACESLRDDGNGTQCPRVYLGHSVPWGYKYGDLAFQVGGVSRIGTIKYGLESRETKIREGLSWRGPAATVNDRPVFSSERALQNNKPATVYRKFQGESKIGRESQMNA